MNEPYVPVSANLYDCCIECDASTKLVFSGLEQCDVLRLMQLVRSASIVAGYTNPKEKKVSLVIEAHEEDDGNSNE